MKRVPAIPPREFMPPERNSTSYCVSLPHSACSEDSEFRSQESEGGTSTFGRAGSPLPAVRRTLLSASPCDQPPTRHDISSDRSAFHLCFICGHLWLRIFPREPYPPPKHLAQLPDGRRGRCPLRCADPGVRAGDAPNAALRVGSGVTARRAARQGNRTNDAVVDSQNSR